MIHVGGNVFWFDGGVGAYSAQVGGQVYGSRTNQILGVTQ